MSKPKKIVVTETQGFLKQLLKKSSPLIVPRIRMLLAELVNAATGISRRDLANEIGVDPNSITNWRILYEKGGIDSLASHGKKGFKPSVFTTDEHVAIAAKLNDAKNGLRGYVELQTWIENEFKKEVKYNTILKYCIKNFGSSVKVARKSHIKKDEAAVDIFKKNLVRSVDKSVQKKQRPSQK